MKLLSDGEMKDWDDGCTLYETAFPGRLEDYVIHIKGDFDTSFTLGGDTDTPQSEPCSRIWWDSPKEDSKTFYQVMLSPEDAGRALQTLTAYDKSQFGYSRSGGLQQLNSVGRWLEAEVVKED